VKLYLVSGWATTNSIWNGVIGSLSEEMHLEYIDWWEAMDGELENRITEGEEDSILIGWSMGGQIALDTAAKCCENLCGLFLVSPFTCLVENGSRPGVSRDVPDRIDAYLGRNRKAYLRAFFKDCIYPSKDPVTINSLLRASDEIRMSWLRSGLLYMSNTETDVNREIPLMIIHGRDDKVIPWECSQYIGQESSNCTSEVYIDNAGHLLPVLEPERIGNLLNEFCSYCST
jgi:pimeloyl-[acyl-carrier protein] methyl ester esterase